MNSRFAINARRVRAGIAVLAVGALGVGFTACGDDESDEATDSVNSILEENGVDTDELQDSAESIQDSVQSEIDEADLDTESIQSEAQDALDEAQKQLDEAQGN